MKRDNAFTGLEAAIVLIAFVVVAAVFSYVMLGAGFFATQKAQEVTYAGIKQATSNVVFEGMMYAQVNEVPTVNEFTGFSFSVKVPGGGMAIDMSNTDFVYTSTVTIPPKPLIIDEYYVLTPGSNGIEYPDACATPMYNPTDTGCVGYPLALGYFPEDKNKAGEPTTILQPGQSALYTVVTGDVLFSDDWFSVEMVPQIGASTLVTKRLDAGLKDGRPLL